MAPTYISSDCKSRGKRRWNKLRPCSHIYCSITCGQEVARRWKQTILKGPASARGLFEKVCSFPPFFCSWLLRCMASAISYDATHQLLLSSEHQNKKNLNFYLYKLDKSNVTTTLQQTLQNLKQFNLQGCPTGAINLESSLWYLLITPRIKRWQRICLQEHFQASKTLKSPILIVQKVISTKRLNWFH